jgi:hypothetical protein
MAGDLDANVKNIYLWKACPALFSRGAFLKFIIF